MISVIIPVYNAEPYLRCCLDSVLDSTYQDFELLLVNDGSTDKSLEICQEYAARDSRVQLLSQQNCGASAARNRGLELCHGEWVVFADADDLISPDFLALVAQEEYQSQDLLLFDFAKTAKDLTTASPVPKSLCFEAEKIPDLLRSLLLRTQLIDGGNLNFVSPCGKAYRKAIIDHYALQFDPSLSYGEDKLFNTEYLTRTAHCTYILKPVYFYNCHWDSLSHRFDPGRILNFGKMLSRTGAALDKNGLFPLLELDFVSYTQEILAFFLLDVIFSPLNRISYCKKCQLCRELWNTDVFNIVSAYRPKGGMLSQRWLSRVLFFFRTQQHSALYLLAQIDHIFLALKGPEKIKEMRNSGWFP